MSEHSKILEKYNQMFEDGSAYKPIRITQPQPSMAEMSGATPTETPLGNPIQPGDPKELFKDPNALPDPNPDYSTFDAVMEEQINKLRNAGNANLNNNTQPVNEQNNVTIQKLENRIVLLEKALALVMEQQTKMLRESK